MNRVLYLAPAVALAMLASCSSSSDVAPDDNRTNPEAEANSYVTISVAMPREAATRAGNNDNFDNGETKEYAVNDGTLIVFKGNSADEATFVSAATFTPGTVSETEVKENQQPNVTANLTQTIKLPGIYNTTTDKFFALAVLNRNNAFTVEGDKLKIDDKEVASNDTWKKINEKVAEVKDLELKGNGFLMANAPISNCPGDNGITRGYLSITSLVDVTDNIKQTVTDAQNNAATIVVERALAKVTVNKATDVTNTSPKVNVDGKSAEETVNWEIKGWGLTNVNTKSFLMRDFDTDWGYYNTGGGGYSSIERMLGTSKIEDMSANSYRTYFGKDPNFDKDATGELSQLATADEVKNEPGKSDYCMENTFDVANMMQKNATHVLLKMQLKISEGGGDFYVIGGNRNQVYTKDGAAQALVNKVAGDAASLKKLQDEALKAATSDVSAKFTDATNVYCKGELGTADEATKKITLAKITFFPSQKDLEDKTNGYEYTPTNGFDNLPECLEYEDGMAYYIIRIRHFNDDYTKWEGSDAKDNESYPGTEEDKNRKWLGRYGVVRNNWYQLMVDGVAAIGDPIPPKPNGNTWLDEAASYCHATIKVLSWAKREQHIVAGQ